VSKKIIITLLVLIASAALGYKAKQLLEARQKQATDAPTPQAVELTISLTKGTPGTLSETLDTLGHLESRTRITLSTKLAGYIRSLPVQESQEVHKGQLLVQIDDTEIRSTLSSLRTTLEARIKDLNLTRTIYERNLKLYKVGGLPKESLEASAVALENKKALVESTREQIAQLEHQLSYLEIRSPFDGVVDRLLLHEGDLAAAGKPILSLISKDQKLTFTYSASLPSPVTVGAPVFADDKEIGTVNRLYASAAAGLNQAEVALKKALNLPTGSDLPISVQLRKARGCVLSNDTLLHQRDGLYVMLYKENRFEPLKVTPLLRAKESYLLPQCPPGPVAKASETKLAQLPAYGKVLIRKDESR